MDEKFKKQFPAIEIERFDERFTSKLASKAIVSSGLGKKKRSDKSLIDKVLFCSALVQTPSQPTPIYFDVLMLFFG